MKKGILRRLSISIMILMLTTVFSFANNEQDQMTENSPNYGFKSFSIDEAQLSNKHKAAISRETNSSKELNNSELNSKYYAGDYSIIRTPNPDSCYCLGDTMSFSTSVIDTYDFEYTCPVVLIDNYDGKVFDVFEGTKRAEVSGWSNYDGSVKLNLSKYTSGTYWFWLINWPCDNSGNLYEVDDWYEDCEWIWVRFYVGPYGKVTIQNTIANSAKKTNDVIWDKSKVKGADKYQINWRAKGGKWASRTVGNTVRGTTSGLTIGQLYEIRVRPMKGGIGGKWSNTVYRYFHTTEKIRLRSNSKGSFTMSWKRNPKATGYQVMYTTNKNGAGAAKNIRTVGANATSYTQKGLKSGATYYVQVREIKKVGAVTYIGNISIPVKVRVK